MTDYDLRTKRALRRVTLLEYGFGPETMRALQALSGMRQSQPRAGHALHRLRRGAAKRPSMTSTSPAIAAVPAAAWPSPTMRCTAPNAGPACRRPA